MTQIKIFTKPLESIEILEYNVNKFMKEVCVSDVKTELGKNKYNDDILIVTVLYEEIEEDIIVDENDLISNIFEDVIDAFLDEYINTSRFNLRPSLTGIFSGFTSRTPSFTGSLNRYETDLDIYDTVYNYNYNYSRNRYNYYYDYLMNSDEDMMNRALQQSLNEQPTLEKTEHIINIPSQEYINVKHNDNKSCCICLVDFEDESVISLTNCDHIFHMDCIIEWSRYKKDCPICRKDLKNKLEKKE